MDVSMLKSLLETNGIDPRIYAIDGVDESEAYVLMKENHKWLMFYSERGVRSFMKVFQDEDSACREFARVILSEFPNRKSS